MPVSKIVPRSLSDRETEPFDSAEEAWLWFVRCQLARLSGVRFTADCADVARPCEPDDIYRAVDRLLRRRCIDDRHVAVLGRFGLLFRAPDPWAGDDPGEARLWREALERLGALLHDKGITV